MLHIIFTNLELETSDTLYFRDSLLDMAFNYKMMVKKFLFTYPQRLFNWMNRPEYIVHWKKLHHRLVTALTFEESAYIRDTKHYRVYMPTTQRNQPGSSLNGCIVYLHGGGWMVGDSSWSGPTLRYITDRMNMPVFAVKLVIYRLSPEHRFPSALDDCMHSIEYLLQSDASKLGVCPNRIVLLGDSAGANLGAVVCHRLRQQKHLPKLKAAALVYPVVQMANLRLPSYLEQMSTGIGTLEADIMHMYHLEYFGLRLTSDVYSKLRSNRHVDERVRNHECYKHLSADLIPSHLVRVNDPSNIEEPDKQLATQLVGFITNPDYSPMFNTDFSGLPPTLVVTADTDLLRDDGILYYNRLQSSGVDCKWINYQGAYHGSFNLTSKVGKKMVDDTIDYLISKIK